MKATLPEPEILTPQGKHATEQKRASVFVLTGGPSGGKTTFMRELRAADPNGQRWVLVPEAAPLLFHAGLSVKEKSFQAAAVRLQMALEDACSLVAPPGAALVCDRGLLDPLAFWLAAGWNEDEFFPFVGFSREELLCRYTGIIHLQSTAIGAESCYRCWPHAGRPETIEQAAKVDALCIRVWHGQRNHVVLLNRLDWAAKSQSGRDALASWL
jgi:hypothetical protein